jgi:hypothetical protein
MHLESRDEHNIHNIWVCLKIGYIPNYSHLIGIIISKTIGFRGTLFSDKPIWVDVGKIRFQTSGQGLTDRLGSPDTVAPEIVAVTPRAWGGSQMEPTKNGTLSMKKLGFMGH